MSRDIVAGHNLDGVLWAPKVGGPRRLLSTLQRQDDPRTEYSTQVVNSAEAKKPLPRVI